MVVLRCPFLIGGRRGTVEQARPAVSLMVKFNSGGGGKFTAVISQDNRGRSWLISGLNSR